MQAELSGGQGWLDRDTESGQLLINRLRHLDVLDVIFWINTFSDRLYSKHLHGDKDTFALGFAAAGKASDFSQVAVAYRSAT